MCGVESHLKSFAVVMSNKDLAMRFFKLVPQEGFEPPTYTLRMYRSTN